MGDRKHLLRPVRAATRVPCLAALILGGCIDFVEPELSERGAPAVTRLVVVVSDSGRLALTGESTPGFDDAGFLRGYREHTAAVGPWTFPADDVSDAGGLHWSAGRQVEPGTTFAALALRPPAVEGLGGPPTVVWAGAERAGPDTLRLDPDGGLRLPIRVAGPPAGGVRPDVRQWFLTLTGDSGAFRLSADGPPPDTLNIPARFLPAFEDGLAARLVYQQSGEARGVDRYVGQFTLDVRLHWRVQRREDG